MPNYQDNFSLAVFILSMIVIVGCLIFGLLQPHFEAKAFNECTGGHASYFTAVFTELRVQECKH